MSERFREGNMKRMTIALFAFLLLACQAAPVAPAATLAPTQPALVGSFIDCVPKDTAREEAKVVRIVDGDTIVVQIGNLTYDVRYIGMDTPERGAPFSDEATARNAEIIQPGASVLMVKDVSERDRYDRLLRYVIAANGNFINYYLVFAGLAVAYDYPPDTACSEQFHAAEAYASLMGNGLWQSVPATIAPRPPTAVPFVAPLILPTAKPAASNNCDPSYPGVCIHPYPPDLDCKDVPYRRFAVVPPDPHGFDGDYDGVGCESS
jgi:micrococcal nuclease